MAEKQQLDQSISSTQPVVSSSSPDSSLPTSSSEVVVSTSTSHKEQPSSLVESSTVKILVTASDSAVLSNSSKVSSSYEKKVEVTENLNRSDSTSALIVKELHNFDPSIPEPSTLHSNLEQNSATPFIAKFMELHAIHPVIKSFLVGSISGTCSTLLFQPLDLLKTRLQAPPIRHGVPSLSSGTAAAGPAGLLTLFGHVVRNEKLPGLWKGITPSLTRCVPGVGLYFASIHGLKLAFDINGEPTPVQSVLLGVTGRSISGVLMIPFTVIKTRFESTVYHYGSIREALLSIYKKEGVRGLTCGLLPTLLRDAPFSGLYLLMYTSTKKAVSRDWIESPTFGPYVRFSCGVVAGIGASLITQPADVLKTKMQLYPDKFHSIPQVAVYVYKKYGAQGYFKGLMPRMIRRTLIAAMSWTVYEQVMKSFGLK